MRSIRGVCIVFDTNLSVEKSGSFINRGKLNLTTGEVERFSVCECFPFPCLNSGAMKLVSNCNYEFGGAV